MIYGISNWSAGFFRAADSGNSVTLGKGVAVRRS